MQKFYDYTSQTVEVGQQIEIVKLFAERLENGKKKEPAITT